ncbi:SH3 domain-containing protein [Brachyspira hampsonii]|uniref:Aerotolerance-related exported protein BatE containing TPR domain n=2 Tax=Brachyspira hampsonii TaxID=1287055 RepID=A0A2U4F712_9SPIR|nr:SH3 domain-containing protein [Brachyspira hampsonii]EKV56980.1 aerotolerance-related exported protein BatE containing TPR domain [Brachyspira hampsonii 30446]ELV06519.1 aerotolerance-related exported protein BatE [Brachyspira hampsonii 30599]MBW5381338.1 SH3 domain-containing protein [Brachyspira hampsonii]MBW5393521.1 SH3 domain-containing protein [Brachyspira hampsonii]OEJ16433.1 aerotolerance protein [Brachyspira hampsonii]
MKKLIIAFLLFQSYYLYSAFDLDRLNNLFESANKLYNEGKYLEANYLYKDIEASNFVSKDLYYNLASSYAAIGSNGYAVLYYEKALNISPFDKEIKIMINSLTGNNDYDSQIIVIMYGFLILFLIFFTLMILMFIKRKNINKFLLMLSVVLLIPTIILNNNINSDYVITVNNANLYSGSSTKSSIVSQISEGEKLRVLEEYTNWYYVKGNFKGWISKSSAEKI